MLRLRSINSIVRTYRVTVSTPALTESADLVGQTILEVGCGSGRFTQIMLDAGMEVYSLDYSNAVDACLANHGLHPNLHIVQGIYEAPFAPAKFRSGISSA